MFWRRKTLSPFRVVEYGDGRCAVEELWFTEVGEFYGEVASFSSLDGALEDIQRRKTARTVKRITEVAA